MSEIVQKNEFKALIECHRCKCKFTSTIDDIHQSNYWDVVTCPQCKENITVKFLKDGTFDTCVNISKKAELEKAKQIEEQVKQAAERKAKAPKWKQILGWY